MIEIVVHTRADVDVRTAKGRLVRHSGVKTVRQMFPKAEGALRHVFLVEAESLSTLETIQGLKTLVTIAHIPSERRSA